jgi:hypothetical protein
MSRENLWNKFDVKRMLRRKAHHKAARQIFYAPEGFASEEKVNQHSETKIAKVQFKGWLGQEVRFVLEEAFLECLTRGGGILFLRPHR